MCGAAYSAAAARMAVARSGPDPRAESDPSASAAAAVCGHPRPATSAVHWYGGPMAVQPALSTKETQSQRVWSSPPGWSEYRTRKPAGQQPPACTSANVVPQPYSLSAKLFP